MIPLKLNPTLGIPIYCQVRDRVRGMIAAEVLRPGERLPSIRELASGLRINPSSAVKAYNELQHAGVITIDHGRGTFVSDAPDVVVRSRDELLRKDIEELLVRAGARGFEPHQVLSRMKLVVGERKGAAR